MARTKASIRIGHPPLDVAHQQRLSTFQALIFLREARKYLKVANHPNTLARVNAAISSAKGAMRISDYRVGRAARGERTNTEG